MAKQAQQPLLVDSLNIMGSCLKRLLEQGNPKNKQIKKLCSNILDISLFFTPSTSTIKGVIAEKINTKTLQ